MTALREEKVVESYVWIGLSCPGTCSSYHDFVWSDGTQVDYNKFGLQNGGFNGMCTVALKYRPQSQYYDDKGDVVNWVSYGCNNACISICKVKISP